MVGALSALNAIAGAYSDDLPVLIIVGAPNSHDIAERRNIHHCLGEVEFDRCARCFEPIVSSVFKVRHERDAQSKLNCTNLD